MRYACAALLCIVADGAVSWSSGKDSWEDARNDFGDRDLWDKPNACDPQVLRSSAPLSVLFGLTNIWERVHQRREAAGRLGQPLEVHVLGAAYPFEGRSDWSLLSKRRPAEVPKVRVSLILGTPFQSDNVPPMHKQPNALLQITPKSGKWSAHKEELICKGSGKWGTASVDQGWKKEDVCKDHGNGLEVVCVEKFYQDVRTDLAHPDLAVMFSPGFPQLGRRSWDPVLIGLLNDKVPTMLSDVIANPSWGYNLKVRQLGPKPVPPGGPWNSAREIGEDYETSLAMKKFGAQKLLDRRGPFPILHFEDDGTLAKNAVIQVYEGYKSNRKPTPPLSQAFVEKYNAAFDKVNWSEIKGDHCDEHEMKSIFKFPTSRPFDNAVRAKYLPDLKRKALRRQAQFTDKQRARLVKYGLLESGDPKQKPKRWGLKAWVFIMQTIGCAEF